ncbi:hypothetical protein [Paraburkholderia nemoris]|uniref:Uncharacterized protein n=1 Tax=Paraburkholderia nemoris TaxID=2793076 RepID=A0ABM8RI64_9BURK|nr:MULTISPECIES: hypothetical protein [Paraburkholderia]MBK3812773.1 hypothetical protein [Paraburkholderia aspalathi]CAE6754168.1 hypothetical protein R69776_03066 [Paraburkholderia nemoris]CAE6808313.1 hypothetical protein R75777_05570 [Paraburkholderia nemoris]
MVGRETQGRTEALDGTNATRELRPWLAIEQQQTLFSSYPLFFRAVRYPEAYPSNLAFLGIQCGLGWYPIVEAAAQEIEAELRAMWCEQARSLEKMASIDLGLLREMSGVYPVIPFCSDIGETGGQLKISLLDGHLCDGKVWLRIRQSVENAVHLARSVCELCGRPGELREIYWHHVYCDECTAPVHFENHVQSAGP